MNLKLYPPTSPPPHGTLCLTLSWREELKCFVFHEAIYYKEYPNTFIDWIGPGFYFDVDGEEIPLGKIDFWTTGKKENVCP